MTKVAKVPSTDEAWETGTLGESVEHAKSGAQAVEDRIDRLLELQLISIRLPKAMIEDYKYIANREGMRYQTLIKQALQRFAVAEMKKIAEDMETQEQRARTIATDQPRLRRCG